MLALAGAATLGVGAILRRVTAPAFREKMKATLSGSGTKMYYQGGFEQKMDRREAALILGLRLVVECTTARLHL